MSEKEALSLNLPTPDEIRQWEEKREQLQAEEADMRARHAAEEKSLRMKITRLGKLIAAAAAFVEDEAGVKPESGQRPPPAPSEPSTRPPSIKIRRRKGETWPATILAAIRHAGRGMTYSELKEEIAKTHLGETLSRTEKAFYGGIGKLADRRKIIKYKGRVYTPAAHRQFMADVAAGRTADIPAPTTGGESPNEIAVKRFLSNRPDGATTPEILENLLNNPPPDLAVTKNRNSIYNLLKRERGKGKLAKRGDRYYLPPSKDKAPGSEEPSASNHHDDGNGTPSSSGNGGTHISLAALPGAIPAHSGE